LKIENVKGMSETLEIIEASQNKTHCRVAKRKEGKQG
jgi:hypothetical protein